MRAGAFLTTIAVLAVSVGAQTRTADGVAAFARGDYQRAAEILQPLAEAPLAPDHAAEFFMGMLYETGRGVPVDELRACALYQRAAFASGGAFAAQANMLIMDMVRAHGVEWMRDCTTLSNLGFEHHFEAATFSLAPGQWIELDLKGVTITYEGKSKRTGPSFASLGSNGGIFLPLQHTELAVGPSGLGRRHFIEVLVWKPSVERQSWDLSWNLYEVVRDEFIRVAGEVALTISAARPPDASLDVRSVVDLRVNDNGDPQWSLLDGSHARTGVIESDTERRDERARNEARRAAEARVDWNRVRPLSRAPAMAYSEADGCGNVFLYGWSGDHTEALAVRADRGPLQLSLTPRTFDLATARSGLQVEIRVYERPVRSSPFCTDVHTGNRSDETWRAIGGTVTIELSPPGVRVRTPHLYRATVRIVNAVFVNDAGARVSQTRPIVLTALVGGGIGG